MGPGVMWLAVRDYDNAGSYVEDRNTRIFDCKEAAYEYVTERNAAESSIVSTWAVYEVRRG